MQDRDEAGRDAGGVDFVRRKRGAGVRNARRAGAGRAVGRNDGREPLLPGEGKSAGVEAKGRRSPDRRLCRRRTGVRLPDAARTEGAPQILIWVCGQL